VASIIPEAAVKRRASWIGEIDKLSGSFGDDSKRIEDELGEEIKTKGKALELKTLVGKGLADTADVEVFAPDYSFVADAKAFRLSRTAKNQKDFKVTAMDSWKRGKKYALLVCPIYQLPTRSSQIYEQATSRNVCIFTYSHLAIVTLLVNNSNVSNAQELLMKVYEAVSMMNPSKDAIAYWTQLNRAMFSHSTFMIDLWNTEKRAAVEMPQM
jgi:hypothetical protein